MAFKDKLNHLIRGITNGMGKGVRYGMMAALATSIFSIPFFGDLVVIPLTALISFSLLGAAIGGVIGGVHAERNARKTEIEFGRMIQKATQGPDVIQQKSKFE